MATSDTPCGGDAFQTAPVFVANENATYESTLSEGCKGCIKSAANDGKCGGGAPEVDA